MVSPTAFERMSMLARNADLKRSGPENYPECFRVEDKIESLWQVEDLTSRAQMEP